MSVSRKGKTEENFELEEDAVALDEVVVSANRSVTKRRLAPTLVNVVDMKMFENTSSSLSQGLTSSPVSGSKRTARIAVFQQVRINGLDGRIHRCIDSRPIFSAFPVFAGWSRFLPI